MPRQGSCQIRYLHIGTPCPVTGDVVLPEILGRDIRLVCPPGRNGAGEAVALREPACPVRPEHQAVGDRGETQLHLPDDPLQDGWVGRILLLIERHRIEHRAVAPLYRHQARGTPLRVKVNNHPSRHSLHAFAEGAQIIVPVIAQVVVSGEVEQHRPVSLRIDRFRLVACRQQHHDCQDYPPLGSTFYYFLHVIPHFHFKGIKIGKTIRNIPFRQGLTHIFTLP